VSWIAWTIVGLFAAAGTAAWAVLIEPRLFRVHRIVLDAGALGLPELSILHVTDTHFHGRDGAILAFLEKLARHEAFDLVLFTGDIIDTPDGVESAGKAASFFEPTIGVYAVLGGHDYGRVGVVEAYRNLLSGRRRGGYGRPNPADRLVQRLQQAGVRVLADEHVVLSAPDGASFALVGLRDVFAFDVDFGSAWRGLPAEVPAIAMAHSPDVLEGVVKRGAKLALFGHTHGGQVRLPLAGAVVTRCRLPGRLARGVFRRRGTIFVTNAGLGVSRVTPYRFLCRPEACLIKLVKGAPADSLTRVEDFERSGMERQEESSGL